MTADGSPTLRRTLDSGQFDIPGPRIELGLLRDVGPFNWIAHRAAGLVLGTRSLKGAEALSLNPLLLWTWLLHSAAITPLSRRRDPNIQLVVLRTVWNAHGRYEWYVHFHVSRLGGISPDTIERVTRGPDDLDWTDEQRALLRAVDDLQRDRCITDLTWKELEPYVDKRRLAELFFVVGLYDHLAMLFNSLGVHPEPRRFSWAPLMLIRRPDDSDALLPARLRVVDRAVARVGGYGTVTVAGRSVPAIILREGDQVAIPLPYGRNRRWVNDFLAAGLATASARKHTYELSAPVVLDAARTQSMSSRVHTLSRYMPVLVATTI